MVSFLIYNQCYLQNEKKKEIHYFLFTICYIIFFERLFFLLRYLTCHCALPCGCATFSSEESAKAKTQKEVIKTLKELKLHLPTEKRHNNKSSTLNTLKYALRCVKQVEGKVHLASLFSVCYY